MSKHSVATAVALGSVTTNAAIDVSNSENSSYWVCGTFVGTVKLQVSPDGTNWVDSGSAVTAPAIIAIPRAAKFARLNCTAWTSGSIEGFVTTVDEDRLG